MTKQDILDYLQKTPHNTNVNVISSMIDEVATGDNKQEIELLAEENKVYTPTQGKVYNKVTVNVPIPETINAFTIEKTESCVGKGTPSYGQDYYTLSRNLTGEQEFWEKEAGTYVELFLIDTDTYMTISTEGQLKFFIKKVDKEYYSFVINLNPTFTLNGIGRLLADGIGVSAILMDFVYPYLRLENKVYDATANRLYEYIWEPTVAGNMGEIYFKVITYGPDLSSGGLYVKLDEREGTCTLSAV